VTDILERTKPPPFYTVTPNEKVRLNFGNHLGQTRVWNSPARFVLMLSGTQGGKTSFGPWWLYREIQQRGAGDYLAATTNYDLFKLKMLPEIRKVFEDVLDIGRYWPGDKVMELRDPETQQFWAKRSSDLMWGRIILRSAEAPAGMESATAKAAWLDEVGMDDWDVTIFEAILRRLSLSQGKLLGTTTVYNSGWLKTEWYDRFMDGDPNYDVIQFSSTMNPAFPKEEYQRAKDTMPTWRFKMFYKGMFARPPGLIYGDMQDTDYIVVNEDGFGPQWPRIVGIDPGGANHASIYVVEDVTVDPSVFIIYDEYLEGDVSTDELSDGVKERVGGVYDVTFIGGAPSETQFRRDWATHDVPIQKPSEPDVEVGISSIIGLIKQGRLKISKKCKGLRHEMQTYKRKMLPDGTTVTEVIQDKNHFHRLDALRYALGGRLDKGWDDVKELGQVKDYKSKWTQKGGVDKMEVKTAKRIVQNAKVRNRWTE